MQTQNHQLGTVSQFTSRNLTSIVNKGGLGLSRKHLSRDSSPIKGSASGKYFLKKARILEGSSNDSNVENGAKRVEVNDWSCSNGRLAGERVVKRREETLLGWARRLA
jgi:hypothetical protein